MPKPIPTTKLKNGAIIPILGQGTWHMGEDNRHASAEIRALEHGIDLGMTLIDTAEMYAEGGAEEVVAHAIKAKRDQVYLVSKVYPHNATRDGVVSACERSLKRLGTGTLDLYLLHWPGSIPLAETVAGFETLKRDGKIKAWGVSNFDCDDMDELAAVTDGSNCQTNQVLYHLAERGVEYQLLEDHAASNTMTMAYSPLGQADILTHAVLATLAQKHGVAPAAIALAFVLRTPDVVAIPKATNRDHVDANRHAVDIALDAEDLAALDRAFPPPRRKTPLGMI